MEGDKFPIGLKVLVVDDSRTCLMYMKQLLVSCKYKVTVTTDPVVALEMLRENKDQFDIVISDVHMPKMDGLKLLEQIGLELDIPVIMSSGDDNPELVMKGVRHGAVDYLVKPVRIEEVKIIWQHVVRKNQGKQKGKANSDSNGGGDGDSNENPKETRPRKRKEQNSTANDEYEEDEDEDSNNRKKPRVVWSADLHKKFVHAVDQLGLDNAFPKKILDFMNEDGLTRENVASHLQKYRLYLKKMNLSSNQSRIAAAAAGFSIQDSPIYMNGGGPLRSSYGVNCGLGSQMNAYNPGLTQVSSCLNVGNPRLIDPSHFQLQNNTRAIAGLSNVKPQTGVPSLQDYTRCMENWKIGSTAQQNVLRRNHQLSSSFNGGFSSNEISYLKNALENPYVQVPPAQDCSFTAPNVGCNMDNIPMIPNIDSSNQGFGQMGADGSSSFMQNVKVQGDEAGELMGLDDNYLLESAELLAGFTQNDCESLDDLVAGLLK